MHAIVCVAFRLHGYNKWPGEEGAGGDPDSMLDWQSDDPRHLFR